MEKPVPVGLDVKHMAVFPEKQNVILLNPSPVNTSVIIAIIFDASVPNTKVVVSVNIFRGLYSATFFPICALSVTEQLPGI